MASAVLQGKSRAVAKIEALPDIVREIGEVSLDVGTDDLVRHLKAAAPIDNGGHDPHRGLLKYAIVKLRNEARGLSWQIMSVARDAKGRLFGRFVEFGHGDAAPRPWWFPTYRAWKKPFRAKLYADTRKALSAFWNGA